MTVMTAATLLDRAASWQFDHLPLHDGWQLRWAFWKAAQPVRGHVLMLPGLGEVIEKRTLRAEEWAERGYQAVSFDWRGQGGSGRLVPNQPRKCHIDSFDTYVDDLREVWQKLWLPRLGKGLAIVDGHSTGTHLALRFLAREQPTQGADLLIAMSPLVDIKTPACLPVPLARAIVAVAARLAPTSYALGQPSHYSFENNYITSDRESFDWWEGLKAARPDLVTDGVTWGWVGAQLRSSRALKAGLGRVRTPVLALLTTNDPHTDGASQKCLPDRLPDCTTVDFSDSRHEIYMEKPEIRARAWQAIDRKLANLYQRA